MKRQEPHEASVFGLSRFREIVADLRGTLQHLGEIEEQMEHVLADMKSQGQSRERLLVGYAMLNDIRGIMVAASAYCALPGEDRPARQRLIV